MEILNTYLFEKRARKQLSASRDRRFVNYDRAKTVLLLFESDFTEKNPVVRKIIQILQQDGKKVSAWGFIDKKVVATAILPDFRILNHKDTDFFQRPQQPFMNELEDVEYDLMIDLSLRPLIPLQYIALHAHAACKTGVRKTHLPVYDFIIDMDNIEVPVESPETPVEELYLFNQIIFYLKRIQTND